MLASSTGASKGLSQGVGSEGLDWHRGGRTPDTMVPGTLYLGRYSHRARAIGSPVCRGCLEPLLHALNWHLRLVRLRYRWGQAGGPRKLWGPSRVVLVSVGLSPLVAAVLLTSLLPPGIPASRAGVSDLPKLHPVPRLPGPLLRLVHRQGPVSAWGLGVSAHPGGPGADKC